MISYCGVSFLYSSDTPRLYSGSDTLWASLVQELFHRVEEVYGADVVRRHRALVALSGEKATDSVDEKREKRRYAW